MGYLSHSKLTDEDKKCNSIKRMFYSFRLLKLYFGKFLENVIIVLYTSNKFIIVFKVVIYIFVTVNLKTTRNTPNISKLPI